MMRGEGGGSCSGIQSTCAEQLAAATTMHSAARSEDSTIILKVMADMFGDELDAEGHADNAPEGGQRVRRSETRGP